MEEQPAAPPSPAQGRADGFLNNIKGAKPTAVMAAITHHARWKACNRSVGAPPPPTRATSIATPIAMPVWRIMFTTPEPVAKEDGGSDPTAVPMRVGSVRP